MFISCFMTCVPCRLHKVACRDLLMEGPSRTRQCLTHRRPSGQMHLRLENFILQSGPWVGGLWHPGLCIHEAVILPTSSPRPGREGGRSGCPGGGLEERLAHRSWQNPAGCPEGPPGSREPCHVTLVPTPILCQRWGR